MLMKTIVKSIIIVAALGSAATASAQLNSPQAQGFYARGVAMYADHNYPGCIDQLTQLRNFTLTPRQQQDAFYYLAMATLHSGDDEAIGLLKEFLVRYPASERCMDVTMSCGDYYFTRGSYAEALEWYARTSPKAFSGQQAADLTYRKAYSEMLTGRNLAARPLFAQLLADRQYGNAAKFYLAYMDYQEKNYTSALKLFADVDSHQEPGTATPYYMAQIYFKFEDYKQALNLATQVLQSNEIPQFRPEANRIAGESLYNLGMLDRALPYLWQYAAEEKNPQPSTLYILGLAEFNDGNIDNATGLFQRATVAEGKIGQGAWLYLGQCYVQKNNADGALMAFEKAYTDQSDPAVTETAFYNYIVARSQGGRLPFANTVGLLEDFLSKYPRSRYAATVQESLISGYMSDGDYQSALQALNRVDNPSEAMKQSKQRVLFELGTREFAAGNIAEAAKMLAQAQNGPDTRITTEAMLWSGNCAYQSGNWNDAADCYLKYVERSDSDADNRLLAYYNLGYTRYKQNRFADAITDFRRVTASPAADKTMIADSYNRIADCLYQQRDFSAAADNYTRALELNPEAGDYPLYQRSVMFGLQGKRSEQIAELNRLMADYSSSVLVRAAMLDKAEAQALLGQTDNAIDTYHALIREYESSSYGRQGYLQLALTQYNAGRKAEAVETYKKVIYTYPTSEEAKLAVDDLKRIYASEGKLAQLTEFLEGIPNAPKLTPSELDALSFQSAENIYLNTGKTTDIKTYLTDYPHGNYEAAAHFYLAEAASADGNLEDALQHATEVTLNHPDSEVAPDAMLVKAEVESRLGKKEIALETYRNLEQRAAGSRIIADARLGIMRTALESGRYSEVLVATDKLRSSSTGNVQSLLPEIKFSEAMALDRLGRHDEAYSTWGEISGDANNIFGAQAAVAMAESMLADNRIDRAEQTINNFINANTPHHYWQARAFIVLSDILRKKGKTFEADEYLNALRANYPGKEADIKQMIDARLSK